MLEPLIKTVAQICAIPLIIALTVLAVGIAVCAIIAIVYAIRNKEFK